MKIVVLDGFTLNPGDLTWEPLRDIGECVVHDRTPDTEVVRAKRRGGGPPDEQDADHGQSA